MDINEKYYSIMNVGVEYWISDNIIERKKNNFTMRFYFTEEYCKYIKDTCIRYYPKHEILFINYFKKIYNALALEESAYAVDAFFHRKRNVRSEIEKKM